MDLRNKILVPFLLLVCLNTFNNASNLTEEAPLSPAINACNKTEITKLIRRLQKTDYFKKNDLFVIITDSEKDMDERWKRKLAITNDNVIIMHSLDYELDLAKTFKNLKIIQSSKFIKILISVKNIDMITSMLEYVTDVFGDVSNLKESIGLVVKVDNNNRRHDEVKKKLVDIIGNYPHKEKILNLAKILIRKSKNTIATITNQMDVSNSTVVDDLIEKLYFDHKGERKIKFRFNSDGERLLNCTLNYIDLEIVRSMQQLETVFNDNFDQNRTLGAKYSEQIVNSFNHLWTASKELDQAKNVSDFIEKMDAVLEMFEMQSWKKESYLHKESEIIKFLLHNNYNINTPFSSVAKKWTQPLRDIKFRTDIKEFYQIEEGGLFFPSKYTKSCKSFEGKNKLEVRGNVVRLSDINSYNCSNVKLFEFFAMQKVVIDMDLNLVGKEVQVGIIAPTWVVVGNRTINLSGEDGKALEKPKADDAKTRGLRNGAAGVAGLPGGHAGSFYGVADTITNGENLRILANGGKGGPGQNGGDGLEGKSGRSFDQRFSIETPGNPPPGWNVRQVAKPKSRVVGTITNTDEYYVVYGKEGQGGGKGGNGGVGGVGGKGGNIILKELKSHFDHAPVLTNRNGEKGLGGAGGKGGPGGKNGINIRYRIFQVMNPYGVGRQHVSAGTILEPNPAVIEKGPDGKDGFKDKSIKMRRPAKKAPYIIQDFPNTVNLYKTFARFNLAVANLFEQERNKLSAFYDSLNTRDEITDTYDVRSLVKELADLEEQFKLHEKIDLTSSYTNLMNRIQSYAEQHIEQNEDSAEHIISKDSFTYIKEINNIDFLSKISMKTYDVMTIFDNIQKYLTTSLDRYKKMRNIFAVTEALDSYKAGIDEKIENAQYTSNEYIPTIMDNLQNNLDQEVEELLNEITELEDATEDKVMELVEQKRRMELNIMMRKYCKVLQGVSSLIGLLPGPMEAVSTVFSTGFDVASETFIPSDPTVSEQNIPKYVENLYKPTEEQLRAKLKEENDFIAELKVYVDNAVEQATNYDSAREIEMVWESTKQIRDSQKLSTESRLKSMEKVFFKKQLELQLDTKWGDAKSNRYLEALEVAEYLRLSLKRFNYVGIAFKKFENNTDTLNVIDKAMQHAEQNLQSLHLFEDQIHKSTQPMLNDMMKNLVEFSDKMKNMNGVELWQAKWNLTQILGDVKVVMEKMTKELKVNPDVMWTFEKLILAVEEIVEINSKIIELKEEKKRLIFITNLHLDADDQFLLRIDSQLRKEYARLQMWKMYNYISKYYDEWIFSLKQYVFPKAGVLLRKFELPDVFTSVNIKDMIRNMKHVFESLQEYSSNFSYFHGDGIISNFRGDGYHGSFYIWNNEEHKEQLKEILAGKAVKLVADVNYITDESAVKFNKIFLKIESKNPAHEEELSKILVSVNVSLTHMGDSKYRCREDVYEIRNSPTKLEFSYKNIDGRPVRQTYIYERIAKGNFMLSPYATWMVQLTPFGDPYALKKLEAFSNEVDLKLIGGAEYFYLSDEDCSRNKVEKYYTRVN